MVGIVWDREPLGRVSDRELALAIGSVTRQGVQAARKRAGKPAAREVTNLRIDSPLRQERVQLMRAQMCLLDCTLPLSFAIVETLRLLPGWEFECHRDAGFRVRVPPRREFSVWLDGLKARALVVRLGWIEMAELRCREIEAAPARAALSGDNRPRGGTTRRGGA